MPREGQLDCAHSSFSLAGGMHKEVGGVSPLVFAQRGTLQRKETLL